jgi:hypothetical protein
MPRVGSLRERGAERGAKWELGFNYDIPQKTLSSKITSKVMTS